MKLIRPIVIGTALLIPASTIVCNKTQAPVTVVKRLLDKDLKILREKEGSLANKLENWMDDIDAAFLYLTIGANNLAEEKTFEKMRCETAHPFSEYLDECIGEGKDDFYTNPNEKQIKHFTDAIKASDKAGFFLEPSMKLSTDELIEKYGKTLDKLSPQTKQFARHSFDHYKESIPRLAKEINRFIQDTEKFNEDAKTINQPKYEPKWGLSLELLKSLKSIK